MEYKGRYKGAEIDNALALAMTALQEEQYKGTVTDVKVNGISAVEDGVADIPTASTSAFGVTKLSNSTTSSSGSMAATPYAVKAAYDLAKSKQDALASGENIKTINGESVLGSGDIVVSPTYPIVERTETTVTIAPNQYNIWKNNVNHLIVTLANTDDGTMNEFVLQFTCGAPSALTLPDNIVWRDGLFPAMEQGKTYVVSIVNNLAVFAEF